MGLTVRKREILANGICVLNEIGDGWRVEERELEFGREEKLVVTVVWRGSERPSLPGSTGGVRSPFEV